MSTHTKSHWTPAEEKDTRFESDFRSSTGAMLDMKRRARGQRLRPVISATTKKTTRHCIVTVSFLAIGGGGGGSPFTWFTAGCPTCITLSVP